MGKLFVVLALASVAIGGMDYEMVQKWQKLKAMESCWGEENMKLVMVDMKKAIAKCGHEDAPELSLPPYRSSYRFVNTMVNKADQYENMDNMVVMFAKMMSMMKNNRHNNYNNYETDSFRPYSQNYHQGSDNMNMMQKMMKMMKGQNYDNSYHMDSHNSNSDMMDMFSQMMNKMDPTPWTPTATPTATRRTTRWLACPTSCPTTAPGTPGLWMPRTLTSETGWWRSSLSRSATWRPRSETWPASSVR